MELPNIAAYAYQDVHVWSALLTCLRPPVTTGQPENCPARGGGGGGADARRWGGVGEMGLHAGPLLCTNFGPKKFPPPPHKCIVKMISAMWGSF